MNRIHLFAFLSLIAASPTIARSQFIGGNVIDEGTRRPTSGLRLTAVRDKDDILGATTDSSGNFYLGPLAPGLYRLRVADGTAAPFMTDKYGSEMMISFSGD